MPSASHVDTPYFGRCSWQIKKVEEEEGEGASLSCVRPCPTRRRQSSNYLTLVSTGDSVDV
uniref:Uncharacterized protein n=1 Tax=Hyaloperonospora arabidopsidis (strain Emoy2) TaxID=559515 RepID=M4BYJ9_HYAAE